MKKIVIGLALWLTLCGPALAARPEKPFNGTYQCNAQGFDGKKRFVWVAILTLDGVGTYSMVDGLGEEDGTISEFSRSSGSFNVSYGIANLENQPFELAPVLSGKGLLLDFVGPYQSMVGQCWRR